MCSAYTVAALAPIKSPEQILLEQQTYGNLKGLTDEQVKQIIVDKCKFYNFSYPQLMIWLMEKESKLGQNKSCGDGGKSCGAYQIRSLTWQMFQRETGRYDLVYSSDKDQIDMTILALRKGYWYLWGPMKRAYSENPIK